MYLFRDSEEEIKKRFLTCDYEIYDKKNKGLRKCSKTAIGCVKIKGSKNIIPKDCLCSDHFYAVGAAQKKIEKPFVIGLNGAI